jgi:hypothetical protein
VVLDRDPAGHPPADRGRLGPERAQSEAAGVRLLLPHGFVLEGDWIYRWRRPPAPAAARVFRQLVRIARRLVDPDSKDHFLEVAWGKEVVPVLREDALFGRLSWLANRGGPFTALNAKDTTVYPRFPR